jgi:hypothetical protein
MVMDPEAALTGMSPEDVTALAEDLRIPGRQADEEDWQFRLRVARARRGCGADLTGLIAQVPENGREHEITCPVCGNRAKVIRYS